jgi:hypothetical protein
VGKRNSRSGFHESFQFHLALHDFHNVFDIAAIFGFLQVSGLFANKFIEAGAGKLGSFFAGLLLCLDESLIELINFFGLFFGLGAGHAESLGVCGG